MSSTLGSYPFRFNGHARCAAIAVVLGAMALTPRPATPSTVYVKAMVDSTRVRSGNASSLVIDAADVLHVSYVNLDGSNASGSGAVRYATRSGADWVAENIEDGVTAAMDRTSLALDSSGNPHVVYVVQNTANGNAVRYAHRVSGTWVHEDIVSGGWIGTFVSMGLDPQGHAHVCYWDGLNGAPVYATNATGAWVSQQIGAYYGGLVPWALVVTSLGQVKFVYSAPFSGLFVARRLSNGSWLDETIDGTNSLVAADVNVVLDSDDFIHVSYRSYTFGVSKYAFQSLAGWSVEETPEYNPQFGGTIYNPSGLGLAADGTAYLSYLFLQYPANKLRVATRTPGGVWSAEGVDNAQGTLGPASLVVDSHGERHFTYAYGRTRYLENTELRHTRSDVDAVGRILRVPADYPTIQAAIDAGDSPDTVRVSPGTYTGFDFHGKALVVQSSDGPDVTILDGQQQDGLVVFSSGEDNASVLEGFTIRNATGGPLAPAAILVQSSAPTIRGNLITENHVNGSALTAYSSSPRIERNIFRSNHSGTWGAAITLQGNYYDSAQVIGNRFENNEASEGAAIYMFNGGRPRIQDNVFDGNSARGNGGAISMVNSSSPLIIQNLFVRNRAMQDGGAIKWSTPLYERGPYVVQNTFVDNSATSRGSALYSDGFDGQARVENNVIVGGADNTSAIFGNSDYGPDIPTLRHNDVYAAAGQLYAGDITDRTGIDGNISVDPAFRDRAGDDYRLAEGSPCIDAGANDVADLPSFDFLGSARVQDGDQNGSAIVDLGAFEFGGAPLLAAAGADIAQACSGPTTPVRLDGSASTGESITFAWSAPAVVFDDPSSATPTGAFPVGVTDVALVVTSGSASARDTVRVTIVDGSPPSLSVSVSPAVLWPPNHQLVPVHATVTATDACSSNLRVSLLWVRCNEPDAGRGNHAGDVQDASPGTADLDVSLRAERIGSQGGRVYVLCYEVRDETGNADTACASVLVPHDQDGRAELSLSPNGSSLVLFGGAGMDARRVAVGSVEIRNPERLTHRAAGGASAVRDVDGDGAVDAVVALQRVGRDSDGTPFAMWTAQGRGYFAVLPPTTAAVETAPVAFAASVSPNPAVGEAVLRYGVPRAEHVRLAIYDVRGRCVATLADGVRTAGTHQATFRPAAGGQAQVYFYRYEMKGQVRTGKFVVLR